MAHILLLEPNNLLAGQYTQYFEMKGHSVSWCQDAQHAINVADAKGPDVVIMELLLAAHSGIEFLYEFRSYSEWRAVPVIVLSRVPRSDIASSDKILEELGVSAYLYKPETSLHRLGQRVASALAGARSQRAS